MDDGVLDPLGLVLKGAAIDPTSRAGEAGPRRGSRRRLDAEMVRRGMAASRTEAALAIRSGQVTVGGRPAAKSSMLVDASEPIVVSGP